MKVIEFYRHLSHTKFQYLYIYFGGPIAIRTKDYHNNLKMPPIFLPPLK